jgi:hypothetical protein
MGREQLQGQQLRQWVGKAEKLIERRLKAARSHADGSLLVDANDSLDELREDLQALLIAARSSFYKESFPAQWSILDPEIVDPERGPTEEGLEAATSEPILNSDQASDLAVAVERARRELMLSSGAYADQILMRPVAYKNWYMTHRDSLTLAMTMALSNAQVALYEAVGRLLIRHELR